MTGDEDAGPVMARLRKPAGERTRFAVIADPHVSTRESGTSKRFEHTLDHLEAAVADVNERDVDAVLSPGDLTKDGEPWNYDAVDSALAGLDAPFYAVPGNHDVPKAGDDHDALPAAAFAERYGPGDLPYHVEVAGLDVLAVNTAGTADRRFETHEGGVSEATIAWLEDELATADAPVVLAHHNLPPVSDQIGAHQAIEPEMADIPAMGDAEPLGETLAAGDAELVISGHYHLPATGRYRGVRELAAPTSCSYPQSYLLCETTPAGTTVRLVPITDEPGLERGHHERAGDSKTGGGLTAIAAARVASFPLVTE